MAAQVDQEAKKGLVTHSGACHCKTTRFEFEGPPDIVAWDCNCSICAMKRNVHTIIPRANFRLLTDEAELSCYQFGTCKARHYFCRVCGVQSFYVPRSNPDGVAVTVACISSITVLSVTVKSFDGQNWESSYATSNIADQSGT